MPQINEFTVTSKLTYFIYFHSTDRTLRFQIAAATSESPQSLIHSIIEMVSKALPKRFNYGGILKEVISERISYDYIVGKRKRVENCPINLLHFPKEKTDNEMRVYMKQTITDIQVKTRALRWRNIHNLVLDSFARKASVSHSKYSRKETLQQQQSRRHLFMMKRLGTLWVIYEGTPRAPRYGHVFRVARTQSSPVLWGR